MNTESAKSLADRIAAKRGRRYPAHEFIAEKFPDLHGPKFQENGLFFIPDDISLHNQFNEQAKKIVLEMFYGFSKDMGQLAQSMFDHNHIHSEVQDNKRRGAFCYSVTPKIKPFVMLNYAILNAIGFIAIESLKQLFLIRSGSNSGLIRIYPFLLLYRLGFFIFCSRSHQCVLHY